MPEVAASVFRLRRRPQENQPCRTSFAGGSPGQEQGTFRLRHRARQRLADRHRNHRGACRHMVKDRMNLTGARWSLDGAKAVPRLRSLRASGHFDRCMASHHRQERQLNYVPAPQNNDLTLAA